MTIIYYDYLENGPGKVVRNLLLGLEKIGVEFKYNEPPNDGDKLIILQNVPMLYQDTNNERLIGPNICILPYENDVIMSLNYKKMILNSDWVKNLWLKWFPEDKIFLWPVGIDTYHFRDMSNDEKTNDCLIYFKQRDGNELSKVISLLNEFNQSYEIIEYGKYDEEQFLNTLSRSKYSIVIDNTESQGIAIQEMMSTNIPLLVWDRTFWDYYGPEHICDSTSVPYWDDKCGVKFDNENDLKSSFTYFLNNISNFNSREYILENLTLEICAEKIISKLYE